MNKAPILAANGQRKPRKKVSVKKKPASSRKRNGRKNSGASWYLPRWVVRVLAFLLIIFFSALFYWFFIRPYSYRWKSCSGDKEYGVCMPSGFEVHGIDISHYQGNINWEELVEYQSPDYPLQFVFVKATEGGDLGDDAFQKNFDSARKYGFIRGAYHFFNPGAPAAKQAQFFINTVKLDSADLPPVLDVEKKGIRSKESLVKAIKLWLDIVEAHYGVKPILYTSYKFKTSYLNDSIFNSYPYWIAHYYVDSVEYKGKWRFWQHTDVGTVPGVEESVDLNIFNGTIEELKAMTIKRKISTKTQ
ncbi:lysozyme [Bacteroides luti]|uniref:Lysozyme n=1 Tax=Bacteroides luti TaxID=1297750 RepID=A0A1M5CHC5_9BACE|nr:glycoside hydrolase family 25 protein [Bacteroides luti]SHF53997.1 lysozyme [Bacteroides luti]